MKKILYIEDEKDEILMVKTRLESAGYDFISASDGEAGLKKANSEHPDLILLDIILPKLNGYEVCCQLKKNRRALEVPVIILTASGAKDLEKQCEAIGVKEIIHKPYESSYLLKKIAIYLGEQ
jgi:CheY-like chemotaxis protein